MQGSRVRLVISGMMLAVASGLAQAEMLHPDPAWQQGTLDNGFSWQVLSTPQRPSDRIEIRLLVNTGSLVESAQQIGYSHLLPRLALTHAVSTSPMPADSVWQQNIDPQNPLPPVVTSYNFTMYNLSLPDSRADTLKEAMGWLATAVGNMTINEQTVNTALNAEDPTATWPMNTKDVGWRYRLKGSALLGHDPASSVTTPVDLPQLIAFYQQWYTPDAMTLFVVGNVDNRTLSEQINKAFSSLSGKREQPAALPTLSPLPTQPVNLVDASLHQDRLSLVWDTPWSPVRESQQLQHYWRSDLAREVLFWRVQQSLSENKVQGVQLGFDCRVLYQRSQCAINIESANATLADDLNIVAKEIANVRSNGLTQQEFDALLAQKTEELNKLFATYAHIDTHVLINQRLRSQQNSVVDIAPEQYQTLRQAFLSGLTLDMLNQELRQQLAQDMAIILNQPQGEPEISAMQLQQNWQNIMQPEPAENSAP